MKIPESSLQTKKSTQTDVNPWRKIPNSAFLYQDSVAGKLGLNLARSEHLSYGPTPGTCEKKGYFCLFLPFLDKLEVTPPFWSSVTRPSLAQIKSTTCWEEIGTQPGPIGAPFLWPNAWDL